MDRHGALSLCVCVYQTHIDLTAISIQPSLSCLKRQTEIKQNLGCGQADDCIWIPTGSHTLPPLNTLVGVGALATSPPQKKTELANSDSKQFEHSHYFTELYSFFVEFKIFGFSMGLHFCHKQWHDAEYSETIQDQFKPGHCLIH